VASHSRGTRHSDFAIGGNDETAGPVFDLLLLKQVRHPCSQFAATRIVESYQQNSVMRSRLEAADIGKVKVLSDEKPALSLSRTPYVNVRFSS